MWFLIKTAFWFAIVLMLLPFIAPQPETATGSEPPVAVGATIEAATSALGDLTGFCGRQPEACKTGGETLAALGSRARDGALIAYHLLDKHFSDGDTVAASAEAASVRQGALPASAPQAASPAPRLAVAEIGADIPVPSPAPVRDAGGDQASAEAAGYLPKPYMPPSR